MAFRPVLRPASASSHRPASPDRRSSRRADVRGIEALEDRQLLSTFTVTNLQPTGTGSLRWAIVQSNTTPGADAIDFGVAGTINVGRNSLPAITDAVAIDGSSAPSYAGAPVVTVDFQNSKGFRFDRGSDGSSLVGLSVVRAGNAGVTLVASHVMVAGNLIGLLADGSTIAGNRGDGVRVEASSRGNLIGHEDPVTSVSYYNTDSVSTQPVSGWQGIRAADAAGQYLISGTSNSAGLLYVGPITGVGGTSYAVNYPGAATTSVYGPDNLDGDRVRLVGSYRTGSDTVNGFLFEGTTADLTNAANYRTIAHSGATFTYVHSTMGGFAVGNYDSTTSSGPPVGTGHAFLYNIASASFVADIAFPGSISNTAYGIWANGGASYTICGGFVRLAGGQPIGQGYLVDYDSATGAFTNWKAFDYANGAKGVEFDTHFEGISSVEKGVYTLSAGSAQTNTATFEQGSFATVRRNTDGSFGDAAWVDLAVPGASGLTTSDSVIGNQVVGIAFTDAGVVSYQATVNSAFQLSNVIAGNGGNGVGIYGSNDNRIGMNFIGTDASGTLNRGNRGNGVLITNGAAGNLVGGQATNGNDPTAGTFVRPPQGNLISGNRGNGVLITGRATRNVLSGNFVGTSASGNSALGNRLDGVAIDRADGNSLLGCTFQQSPFVFYNVLSGNGGNGLRITNSNNTTVQANFMGVGANNATIVANGGDGLLISGTSRNTQVGGVIPLGNVISGNNRNGIEVKDKASGFISFNTFGGVYAFGGAAPNRQNGILITSSGGDNVVRTSIISGNLGNGIELGGAATGVQITEVAAGMDTSIQAAIPNGGSGIKISGRAHGNVIGGFQPSVVPQVTLSANGRYGVEVVGSARDNAVYHTAIGTNAEGGAGAGNLGNGLGGVYLGAGTSSTTIGGTSVALGVRIANNRGNGVTVQCSKNNRIVGDRIDANQGYGVQARGVSTGTVIHDVSIADNALGSVDLTGSSGVVYIS
ncbi:beta strand repeat-containing protein [Paludisphaera mucosa]|uniref:Right-handed parallel beta-helix repeat-containing protein n=1 Tax=Paludisphaera mucosa TaxID=3030827 RepID=A0ABT6F4T0_9BACT|nr:right-handed parallel beta-helix repeat-containing protein [Paludisphaera mucosa]MDG3002586.1 right-handed parallel beta-helix repeat-containing protein [Paludisphaera mucosa]